jgi:hypothetical protein
LLESFPPEGKYPANIFGAAIKNCGKTPAHVLEAALHYFLLDRNEFDSLSNEPKFQFISREGLLLVPQDSFGEDVLLNSKNRGSLDMSDAGQIGRGEKILFFYGSVKYRDAFGKERETRVGYEYYFPQGGNVRHEKRKFRRIGKSAYNKAT